MPRETIFPSFTHSNPQLEWKDRFCNPRYIRSLLKKVKHEKILISHMKGKDYKELEKINCFFDFSIASSPLWKKLGSQGLEDAIGKLGINRCCFSDEEMILIATKNAKRFLDS